MNILRIAAACIVASALTACAGPAKNYALGCPKAGEYNVFNGGVPRCAKEPLYVINYPTATADLWPGY